MITLYIYIYIPEHVQIQKFKKLIKVLAGYAIYWGIWRKMKTI